uniref:SWIM-type domain-containing protein n=1 Tax=Lactuca sativa TaxID=4236 RepID=A0A9R1X6K7_LACSA|nr:hypothetical protein LSAT_V11C600313470 [Lactuca sativa]
MLEVIDRRINKSFGFRVYQIDQSRYEVTDQMKNGIVKLESRWCTCWRCQLSGIPYSHAMTVFKELRYQHCKIVLLVPVPSEFEEPVEFMVVLPSLMDKRQVRRPQNHNCIPSQDEGTVTLSFLLIQQKINLEVGPSQVSIVKLSQRVDLTSKLVKKVIIGMILVDLKNS